MRPQLEVSVAFGLQDSVKLRAATLKVLTFAAFALQTGAQSGNTVPVKAFGKHRTLTILLYSCFMFNVYSYCIGFNRFVRVPVTGTKKLIG